MGLHGSGGFLGTGVEDEGEARMIIERGERVTAARVGGEVAFEVQLPQRVGDRALKGLVRRMLGGLCGIELVQATQDAGNGAGRGDVRDALGGEISR